MAKTKNSTEPQKNSKKHVFLTNPQNVEKHTGAGGGGGGGGVTPNTQKHVFWGLTKNIEKHVYHLGSRPVSRNWVTNITRNTALLNKKKVKIDLASP